MKLTKRHKAYFKAAKAISELSDIKQKIGCVVVYKHRIISSGYNHSKTCPLQKQYNKYRFNVEESILHSVHAETDALLPLLKRKDIDFSHVSIYLYRQYKNGDLAPSRPCESCLALMRSLGVRHLYFTGNNKYFYEEIKY